MNNAVAPHNLSIPVYTEFRLKRFNYSSYIRLVSHVWVVKDSSHLSIRFFIAAGCRKTRGGEVPGQKELKQAIGFTPYIELSQLNFTSWQIPICALLIVCSSCYSKYSWKLFDVEKECHILVNTFASMRWYLWTSKNENLVFMLISCPL